MTKTNAFIISLALLIVSSIAIAQGYIPQLNVDNIRLDGNTISTLNSNGDLTLDMNGTGAVIFNDLTATTVPYLDGSKQLTSSAVTPTELGYLSGVTSSLCGINQSCTLTNKTLSGNTATNLISGSGTFVFNTGGNITVPGGVGYVLTEGSTATVTNKTLTSPTLTTPTADVVTWDDQTGTPSNPSAGYYKTYFKDDGKMYKLNSSGGEEEIGSGSGGGSSGINILADYNHNAELGASTHWTETGGGTLSTTSTAANVANGGFAFSYDASAANDYLSSNPTTIPAGLFGANCLAQFYYKGFDTNVTAQVIDGSGVTIQTQALTAASTYTTASLNFICPSSGTLELRLLAAADAAIGYLDEVHLGSALNLSNVSQAQFIGSAYIDTTASCQPTRANTALGAFGTDTDCPGPTVETNPGPGTIQTTDADLPKFTVNNLPPGEYMVIINGFAGLTGAGNANAFTINDGTTSSGRGGVGSTVNAHDEFIVVGNFSYTAAGNRSFELYTSSASGTMNLYNSSAGERIHFRIYRFPSSTETGFKPDASPQSWNGYHDSTCSWARTNTAFGDPAADATCTLTERTNVNFGTVASYLSGSDKLPGITFTPKRLGRYLVTARTSWSIGSSGVTAGFELTDGTVTVAHGEQGNAANYKNTTTITGIYNATSLSSVTLRLRTKSASGTVTMNGTDSGVDWSIVYLDTALPAPYLVNSVVNSSSGVTNTCSAYVTNSGTASVSRSDGNCLSFTSDNGTGDSTFAFAAGTFSSTPNCVCTVYGADGWCEIASATALSSTVVRVRTRGNNALVGDRDFFLLCMGAK